MTESSQAFRAFVESANPTFSNRASWESLDLGALDALSDDERDAAVEFIGSLLDKGDVRAVWALEHVGTKRARVDLEAVVDQLLKGALAHPEVGVAAMQALESFEGTSTAERISPTLLARLDDAAKLRVADIRAEGDPNWEAVLRSLLGDSDQSVRIRAAKSLVVRAGLGARVDQIGSRAWIERMWLSQPLPGVQAMVSRDLADHVARASEGTDDGAPEDMSVDLDAFLTSLACPPGTPPWGEHFNLEALCKLHGLERDYMEMSLVSKVFLGERRAPSALVALGGARGQLALAEIAKTATEPMKSSIDVALANG